MRIRAIGLSIAGLLITGGLMAGVAGVHADHDSAEAPRMPDVTHRPVQQPVSADERARVTAAVSDRDSTVSIHAVRRGPDGTLHALGSKAGEPVLAEVSKNYVRVSVQERPSF